MQVFSILVMVALVFVFTTSADPAPAAPEEHGKIWFEFIFIICVVISRCSLYYYYIWVILVYSHWIVSETLAQKSEPAATGKAASAHSHHVKRVKDGKKHEPSKHSREAKAVPKQDKKGATAPIHVPEGAPAVGPASLAGKKPAKPQPRQPGKPGKPVFG
jgi:hypothetical protein